MKYCCKKFKGAIKSGEITRAFYPSGVEYYMSDNKSAHELRVYYCRFCRAKLEV